MNIQTIRELKEKDKRILELENILEDCAVRGVGDGMYITHMRKRVEELIDARDLSHKLYMAQLIYVNKLEDKLTKVKNWIFSGYGTGCECDQFDDHMCHWCMEEIDLLDKIVNDDE